ncbi:MAG: histidinol-phosphatase HisJ family protein [Mycoplasma sp.]
MKHNYHSHTFYCRHSENVLDTLVQKAIENNFSTFGISEHMPIPTNKGRSFSFDELDALITEFKAAKEKYKDKIELFFGLECEYHHELHDLVKYYFEMKDIDYLIFGNHFLGSCKEKFKLLFDASRMDMLMDQLINLKDVLETRMFSCINHPDWFVRYYQGWDEHTINLTNEMIKASIKYDVPLEFNLNGMEEKAHLKDEWMYPYENFWKIVAESNAKVIIGVDAHVYKMVDNSVWDKGMSMIKKLGLEKNLTKKITFQK